MHAFALDIGGSGVRAAALDETGMPTHVGRRRLTASLSHPDLWSVVLDCLGDVMAGRQPTVLGVSFPAFLSEEGRILGIVNLPVLEGVHLEEQLRRDVGAQHVVPIPDLGAAAIAEARRGAGRGHRRVLVTGIGTGVNAALAVEGRLCDVALGALGDAGHVIVEPDGSPCPCGGRGCLEAVCSGAALEAAARAAGDPDLRGLVRRAERGERGAAAVLERAGRALGRAIAGWAAMLVVDRVVVAGGVARIGDLLLEPARDELRRVGNPQWTRELAVVSARFPVRAALIGAGLVARDHLAAQAASGGGP